MDQDATWYGGKPLPRPHCARWGPSSPPKKKTWGTAPPRFLAHVCCGQTAVWIKMPLCKKVGIGLSHIVLHGDPAPPPQRRTAPIFGPCLLWPSGRPPELLLSTYFSEQCSNVCSALKPKRKRRKMPRRHRTFRVPC